MLVNDLGVKKDDEDEDEDVYICSLELNNYQGCDKKEDDDECSTMILVLKSMLMMRVMMCAYVH